MQIYKDKWIPKPIAMTFKPILSPLLHRDASVAEMIDFENQWNENLIRQHFLKEDAEAILKILLLRRSKDDEVLWHFGKEGYYSVKSGYQIDLQLKYSSTPSSSGNGSKYWNDLWNLNLPEKIKFFLRRAARNLLPTAENL